MQNKKNRHQNGKDNALLKDGVSTFFLAKGNQYAKDNGFRKKRNGNRKTFFLETDGNRQNKDRKNN